MNIQASINSALHSAATLKAIHDRNKAKAATATETAPAAPSAPAPAAPMSSPQQSSPASAAIAQQARVRLQERGDLELEQRKSLQKLMERTRAKKGADTADRLKAALGQRNKIREEVEAQYGKHQPSKR